MASTRNPFHRLFGVDLPSHGNQTPVRQDPNQQPQVICLGLSRTGTTSLQFALDKLGYTPCHGGVDIFRSSHKREAWLSIFSSLVANGGASAADDPALQARMRSLMRGYAAATDLPLCYCLPETVATWPDAKYILTVRQGGGEAWRKSMWNAGSWHYRRDGWRYLFRSLIYSANFLRRFDDLTQVVNVLSAQRFDGYLTAERYDRHNAAVRKLVPKGQLLEYDVRQGWEPLCEFLGKPVPEGVPFPNTNDSESMRAIYVAFMTYGAFVWAVYTAIVLGAAYLAFLNPGMAETLWRRATEIGATLLARLGLQ